MKYLLLLLAFVSFSAYAEIFEVHSVIRKESEPGTWIIKFMDGRVGFWKEEDDTLLDARRFTNTLIDAHLSEGNILTGVRIVGNIEGAISSVGEKLLPNPHYTPTVYASYNYASDMLSRMRRQWRQDSQCYDRSHVWSYEEAYYGRYMQKAFLFFSDSYISRYNYKWWFHTAPYALVKLNGQTVERVMDPGFSKYPIKFKVWTDIFMRNKAECKLVTKYSDYSRRPGEDDCYIIKSSIYFWQPKDLEAYETSGIEKKNFIDWEIRHAYLNGYGLYL